MDNAIFLFDAGATGWLLLSLIYDPPDDVQACANEVIEAHPDRRAIVLTHAYLGIDGQRTAAGERIWEGLVRHHLTSSLVLNGHYVHGEAARLVSEGDHGNPVVQLFANYQERPYGGAGLLRILDFAPDRGELAVSTYSPWLDFWEDDDANQFVVTDLPLGPPEP